MCMCLRLVCCFGSLQTHSIFPLCVLSNVNSHNYLKVLYIFQLEAPKDSKYTESRLYETDVKIQNG